MLRINPPLRGPWPPPPHDPRERLVVCRAGDWEVRSFPTSGDPGGPLDRGFEYFAPRSLWHVQLWHPLFEVSILTPSGLTVDHYEVFPIRGWKQWATDYDHLCAVLHVFHRLAPPSEGLLQVIEEFFVRDPVARFMAGRPDRDAFVPPLNPSDGSKLDQAAPARKP